MWPFNKRKRDQELDEEIRAHLAMAAQDRIQRGQAERDAALDARREFGSVDLVKEVTRDIWGKPIFDGLGKDLHYAVRSIFKSPGFAAVAILSIALATGANTAVFSVVHHLLIEPLPYPSADRLVVLNETSPDGKPMSVAYPNFKDWRAQLKSFEAIGGIARRPATLTGVSEPAQLIGRSATANMFDIFGAKMVLGRPFTAQEDQPGGPAVVVLNHQAWEKYFAKDPNIVGKSIRLDNQAYAVIGVLSPDLKYFGGTDEFYTPMAPNEANRYFLLRGNHTGLSALGRLRKGVPVSEATAELKALAASLSKQYPETNSGVEATLKPLNEALVEGMRTLVLALFAAVAVVLLIACANVANLLLARVTERRKEISIRAALGASGWRIARELLCESLVLALAGGLLGALLAYWGVAALRPLIPGNYRLMRDAAVNLPVLGFALLISIVSAAIFGLWPSIFAASPRVQQSRGASHGSPATAFRRVLLAAEVGLTIVLAVGAVLLTRSLLNAMNVQLGFRSENLLTAQVRMPSGRYNEAQIVQVASRMREEIQSIPGVRGATSVYCLPVDGGCWGSVFIVDKRAVPERANLPSSNFNIVATNYFDVMGIELKKGRTFLPTDSMHGNTVAVINETAARRFFPGEDPIGRRVKQSWPEDKTPWREVIGVVTDVRQDGPTAEQRPEIFLPFTQEQSAAMWWVVRTTVPPAGIEQALRTAIRNVDRDVPLQNVHTMEWRVASAVEARRFTLTIAGALGLMALIMAAAGVFSVIAYLVNQRTREIGIRVALGARSRQIIGSVLSEGLRMSGIGIGAGLLVAAGLMRWIKSLLFGVEPFDPVSFIAVAVGAVLVALLACLIPSLRAARVDPVIALRTE